MEEQILNLEKLRERILKHMMALLTASIVIALTVVYLISLRTHNLQIGLFLLIFVGAGSFLLLSFVTGYNKKYKEYKTIHKKLFVEGPFNEAFGQVYCDFDRGISKDVIDRTDMMLLGNRYYTNDYISGSYKDVGFERADIKIQHHTSNGKHSRTVTYFNGRWLILEFNKKFHFDLQIVGKGFNYSQKNNSIFTRENNRRRKIELEDIRFNETFNVYAQNDHEAFYILTPQFMDTLKGMYNSMDGDLMLGFVDNKLHVAIHTQKDAMEPSIFKSVLVPNLADVRQEINSIISIIDGLNLDRDIYK